MDIASLIKRYFPWIVATAVVFYVAFTPAMLQVILNSVVAVLVTIIMSEFAQFVYTTLKFTNRIGSTDNSNVLALGLIYLGTAIVVGLTIMAYYFLAVIPTSGGSTLQ
ncbi:MAG: hypothetical protein HYX66_08920 [Ignavibacteria bacterium]|nr:hypothetical protein [Ignavibacteria bacterium]